jgi:hypothetical protein
MSKLVKNLLFIKNWVIIIYLSNFFFLKFKFKFKVTNSKPTLKLHTEMGVEKKGD